MCNRDRWLAIAQLALGVTLLVALSVGRNATATGLIFVAGMISTRAFHSFWGRS